MWVVEVSQLGRVVLSRRLSLAVIRRRVVVAAEEVLQLRHRRRVLRPVVGVHYLGFRVRPIIRVEGVEEGRILVMRGRNGGGKINLGSLMMMMMVRISTQYFHWRERE
uniref:Uncharacterized protein n=1 Tax=Opuntia streptacantha TaxID=393608 RepID=A0A7C9CI01_OPUST